MKRTSRRRARTRAILASAFLAANWGCGGGGSPANSGGQSSLAPDPATRAAMEVATARRLESSRKTAEAIATYQRIVKEHPESPQAKFAAERLAALRRP